MTTCVSRRLSVFPSIAFDAPGESGDEDQAEYPSSTDRGVVAYVKFLEQNNLLIAPFFRSINKLYPNLGTGGEFKSHARFGRKCATLQA